MAVASGGVAKTSSFVDTSKQGWSALCSPESPVALDRVRNPAHERRPDDLWLCCDPGDHTLPTRLAARVRLSCRRPQAATMSYASASWRYVPRRRCPHCRWSYAPARISWFGISAKKSVSNACVRRRPSFHSATQRKRFLRERLERCHTREEHISVIAPGSRPGGTVASAQLEACLECPWGC